MTELERFCVCGRRVSSCDGSRALCVRRRSAVAAEEPVTTATEDLTTPPVVPTRAMPRVSFRVPGSDPIVVTFDDDELLAVEKAAAACGLGVSAWMAAVLEHEVPEVAGLKGPAAARVLLLVAAGVSDLGEQVAQVRETAKALRRKR